MSDNDTSQWSKRLQDKRFLVLSGCAIVAVASAAMLWNCHTKLCRLSAYFIPAYIVLSLAIFSLKAPNRRMVLYAICILEAVAMVYLSEYTYSFREQMSWYGEDTPPLRNVIATSLLFAVGAPFMPAFGAVAALGLKK